MELFFQLGQKINKNNLFDKTTAPAFGL